MTKLPMCNAYLSKDLITLTSRHLTFKRLHKRAFIRKKCPSWLPYTQENGNISNYLNTRPKTLHKTFAPMFYFVSLPTT